MIKRQDSMLRRGNNNNNKKKTSDAANKTASPVACSGSAAWLPNPPGREGGAMLCRGGPTRVGAGGGGGCQTTPTMGVNQLEHMAPAPHPLNPGHP